MKDRLSVEVEPLSEARWAKVERAVLLRPEAASEEAVGGARRRWGVPAFGGLALAASIALTLFAERRWVSVPHEDLARIVTLDGGSRFTFGESTLEVAPNSTLLVRGDDAHGVNVVVDRGGVTCEVAPRHGRPPFVVSAGEVNVRVVGTRFTVARTADFVGVTVDHGAVEVTSRGVVTMLHPGERWPTPAPEASIAPPLAPAAASAPAEAAVPLPANEPAKRPPAHPRSPKGGALHAAPPAGLNARSADAPSAAANDTKDQTPEEQFELATTLERARPDQAEALYRRVIATGGAWAPNALYALARLKADHGATAEARRLLERYLDKYPLETNATDARGLRDRLR